MLGIQRLVDAGELRPDRRLPSIRRFAAGHGVSKFAVVRAYDRLEASGYVRSRRGSGYFVCKVAPLSKPVEGGARLDRATDILWLIRQHSNELRFRHRPGAGWLPRSWLQESGLDRAMREVARRGLAGTLGSHGDPHGYAPLREDVSRRLAEIGVDATREQIVLTNGVRGGIDLVGRHLIRPDDVVLVDDPGHFRNIGHMRALGATIHGVPWTSSGPDLERLESLARTHRPKLLITTPIVHNPTGISVSQGAALRLLQLAERYDFLIIEDDVHGACHPAPPPRLARLDQLNRVIYLNEFSRSFSPRLPVGIVAGHRDLIEELVDLKLSTHVATSEYSERLVHGVLGQWQYRTHCARLLANLQRARERALPRLQALGLRCAGDDTHGLFAWMDVPGVDDTTRLAEVASERDMLLAPGAMFRPDMRPSSELRFNVAFSQSDETIRELETLLSEHVPLA